MWSMSVPLDSRRTNGNHFPSQDSPGTFYLPVEAQDIIFAQTPIPGVRHARGVRSPSSTTTEEGGKAVEGGGRGGFVVVSPLCPSPSVPRVAAAVTVTRKFGECTWSVLPSVPKDPGRLGFCGKTAGKRSKRNRKEKSFDSFAGSAVRHSFCSWQCLWRGCVWVEDWVGDRSLSLCASCSVASCCSWCPFDWKVCMKLVRVLCVSKGARREDQAPPLVVNFNTHTTSQLPPGGCGSKHGSSNSRATGGGRRGRRSQLDTPLGGASLSMGVVTLPTVVILLNPSPTVCPRAAVFPVLVFPAVLHTLLSQTIHHPLPRSNKVSALRIAGSWRMPGSTPWRVWFMRPRSSCLPSRAYRTQRWEGK